MSKDQIKRVAGAMRQDPGLGLRQGVVDAVNGDGTIDVTLGGSAVVIPGVKVLSNVISGEGVFLLQQNGDLFALGAPDASPRGLLGYEEYVNEITSIGSTRVNVVSVTCDIPANRRVRVWTEGLLRYGVGETGDVFWEVYDGADLLVYDRNYASYISNQRWKMRTSIIHSPSEGSHTYTVKTFLNLGAQTFRVAANAIVPVSIGVEDVGPA